MNLRGDHQIAAPSIDQGHWSASGGRALTPSAVGPAAGRRRGRDFLVYAIGRPAMLVLWTLVIWGTGYAGLLAYTAIVRGPPVAVARTLGGRDPQGAAVNLGLAGVALVVWVLVGVALAGRARKRRRSPPLRPR